MQNNWTGGQYSLYRSLLGIYLFVHFVHLLPWSTELFSSAGIVPDASMSPIIRLFPNILAVVDSPAFVLAWVSSGAVAALCFIVGYGSRIAAVWMWIVLASLLGRNPLISNPSLPYAGWLLLMHLFVPNDPYGSFEAHRRNDPGGQWRLPREMFLAAWVILALSYSYSGYTKLLSPSWVSGDTIAFVLENPLARDTFLREFALWLPPICLTLLTWSVLYIELLFAPLVVFARLRPIFWGLMLLIQFGFLILLNFADLTCAMLLFHLLTFNPAWVRPNPVRPATLYYDGQCGLCHGVVRFLLAEDTLGTFKFAPLQGDAFARNVSSSTRAALPDSIALVGADGTVRLRSAAIVELLRNLGGLWTILSWALRIVPTPIRDFGYDAVGSIRYKLVRRPSELCPLVPAHLRSRFVD